MFGKHFLVDVDRNVGSLDSFGRVFGRLRFFNLAGSEVGQETVVHLVLIDVVFVDAWVHPSFLLLLDAEFGTGLGTATAHLGITS